MAALELLLTIVTVRPVALAVAIRLSGSHRWPGRPRRPGLQLGQDRLRGLGCIRVEVGYLAEHFQRVVQLLDLGREFDRHPAQRCPVHLGDGRGRQASEDRADWSVEVE